MRTSRRKKNRAEWKRLVAEQQSSGLSVREFCKQHDLGEARFYSWRKIARAAKEVAERTPATFLPVTVNDCEEKPSPASSTAASRIDIFLGNGSVVRISGGMSEDQLVSLLSRLGESQC